MAAKKRPARIEDLSAHRGVSDPQFSPDGRSIAYTVFEIDTKADRTGGSVWVARLDGSGAPRRFTQEGAHASNPRWSPDGSQLAFVSNRGSGSQLFLAPLDGGEARQLTQGASISDPTWSPDGTQIAFVRTVGRPKRDDLTVHEKNAPKVIRDLYYRFDGAGLYDEGRRHIFLLDLASGRERQLTRGDWHAQQPAWSLDSRNLIFVADRGRERWNRLWRTDVWLVPARGGRARRLTRGRGAVSAPAFSPDGKRVAYVGHELGDRHMSRNYQLFVVGTNSKSTPRSLTSGADLSVSGYPLAPFGKPFAWLPDGGSLVFLAGDRGTVPVWQVELASGAVKKVFEAELQASALSLSPDGRRVAMSAGWSSEFPEIFAAPLRRGRDLRRVSNANAELRARVGLVETQRISYRAPDGLEVEAFVLYPPDYRKGQRRPLYLNIHGGPQGAHPGGFNVLHHQIAAAAGYVVLLPNPRGSTSYGEAFSMGVIGDWGGGDYEDLMAGVDALVKRKVVDPEQLYVGGYSYGGYMSSWMVGQTDRFRAAVIGAPITNLVSSFGTDDIPHATIDNMKGTLFSATDEYVKRSPLTFVDRVRTPVLLQHWEGDLRCPIAQSEEFFAALKVLGREVEFVRYPGGSHVSRTPSQDADCLQRTLDWFAQH